MLNNVRKTLFDKAYQSAIEYASEQALLNLRWKQWKNSFAGLGGHTPDDDERQAGWIHAGGLSRLKKGDQEAD